MGTVITMQYLILLSLAACALSAPQQVPYVHVEIPAEPYVHVEIPAEPYYGGEPTGYAGPAWTGGCVNNLGQGVPCRQRGEGCAESRNRLASLKQSPEIGLAYSIIIVPSI